MQGLGRLKKQPPIISISGPGPLVPDCQLLRILRLLSFRNQCFLQGQVVSLLEDQGASLSLGHYLRPVWQGRPYQ